MCPKQGMEPCQKHIQAHRERPSYILLARGRTGTPGCVNKRAGGKRVCGGFWSQYAHGQQKRDLNSAELETMRTSRSPTTVMTADGEVQTREEAPVYVKELNLFVTVILLEETPAVLSLGKLCEDQGYTYRWTSGQKPHLIRKGKRIDCAIYIYIYIQLCTIWSQEETEWQEQGAREAASKLAKSILKLKEQERATFFSPSVNRCLPASTLKPEEREFVVDSSASMHIISKKDLNSAELETVTTSRSPTTVITANGEVQTDEEATVYVKELDIFLTMKVLENTPAVLSLGKLCD